MMTHLYRKPIVLVVVLLLLFGVAHLGPDISLAQGPFDPSDKTLVDQLEQITGGDLRISYHSETGKVHLLGHRRISLWPDLLTWGLIHRQKMQPEAF